MNSHEAQATLDDIRRLQDRTRDELVRPRFALPHVLLTALGLFVMIASGDLQRPWNVVACLLGLGWYMGVVIVQLLQQCRASVRPRSFWMPAGPELMLHVGWAVSILLVSAASRIAASAFDLAAPGTIAATVVALAYVAATPLFRRAAKATMQSQNGRG